MGKKPKKIARVVLDTNVVIPALLFKGELSGIVGLDHSCLRFHKNVELNLSERTLRDIGI